MEQRVRRPAVTSRLQALLARASGVRWRYFLTPPLTGAENMALDEALLSRARATHEAVLRVYSWRHPTLSLGRNQSVHGLYDRVSARRHGVTVVRRPTGGRAVLHHREATYSVTAPAAGLGSLRESYHEINRLLLDGLRELGVRAEEALPGGRAPTPGSAPCFEQPVAGELVVGSRKLVGSAQVRDRGTLLQHGSILIEDDQWLVQTLLNGSSAETTSPATLTELLGRSPDVEEIAEVLFSVLLGTKPGNAVPLEPEPDLLHAADRARARYEDSCWTWRL